MTTSGLPSQQFLEMVANETGVTDLTLETAWNIYDTLFCEVCRPQTPGFLLQGH